MWSTATHSKASSTFASIYQGSDAAMFAVANEMPNRLDEVTTYPQGRYISSSEAVWCLLNFPIHQRYQ
ncbi:hypothetical protein TNCT_74521 [Trichonephila clavata]|uniref:Uncharacterized protein n=1 Tax=Trichonephila clavata TaxID=2740835 RepID=A0A8X6K1M1_TRICU|nr:hypothetical protein TNCT_74521 [Trichonephila clavata]